MVVMVVCGLLLAAGLAAIVRWGGLDLNPPALDDEEQAAPSPGLVARRYVWYVTVAVVSGLGSGVLVAGAGGRLAMRLLAFTAGADARGLVTEADEIVGTITLGGTFDLVVFTALFFGMASGVIYLLIRRWLPGGRLRGLAFGGLLLVVFATRIEPLRSDNFDFDLVGPGWLSLSVFGALVVAHGMSVAALAGRYSRALPLLSRRRRAVVGHAPLVLLVPMAPVLLPVTLAGVVTVLSARVPTFASILRSRRAKIAGRIALVIAALAFLPGFVSAAADIAGRGP